MIDLEELRRQKSALIESIAAREVLLENDHAWQMDDTRQTLTRVQAIEPVIVRREAPSTALVYKQRDNARIVDRSAPEEEPLWVDAVSIALTETRIDLHADMRSMVDAATTPLRERLAAAEARVEVLLAMLGADKPADPAQRLRLLKP